MNMSGKDLGRFEEDILEDVQDLEDCGDELTDDDLDDVSGGDDGWGTGTPPPPTDGG
jgi:hypothetical protein